MPSSVKTKSKPISNVTPSSRRSSRPRRRGGRPAPGPSGRGRTFESGTVQLLYDRYVGNDPKRIEAYEQEVLNADLARKLFELRTQAGLSQRQLAELVGTSASAICRLEDADYEGHSLSVLKRIAEALDRRIEIRFVSKPG